MDKNQAKQLLPIIQAFAEGKTIEQKCAESWVEVDEDCDFHFPANYYRIKPESKYRPFKNGEECWQEMQKHQPFGWVKIDDWYCSIEEIRPVCAFCHGGGDVFHFADMVKAINFADGTPFGIKEEE